MITEEIINKWLYKNVSYLFTIPLYDIVFHSTYTNVRYKEIAKYVVNTYTYNEEDDHFTVVLKNDVIDIFEHYLLNEKLIGYIEHEVLGNYIIVKLNRDLFIPKDLLMCLETNNYSNIINTNVYKSFISQQKDFTYDLQKQIVENNEELLDFLREKYNTNVNAYWKIFDIEEETLTLQKIKDMSTELKIQKDWILSKIKNADIISKIAYEDVLYNATELLAPAVIALGKQDVIDYDDIYNKVKEALIKKCGKSQYQLPGINGGKTQPLMFSAVDFKTRLNKTIKKYKLEDTSKVTTILCDHVSKLSYPTLKYYILHEERGSQLATDYELYVESKEISKPQSFEI